MSESEPEPLAVIKVTFDDLPEELKSKIYLFFGVVISCLILLNIVLCTKIFETFYNKIKLIKRHNGYEPV